MSMSVLLWTVKDAVVHSSGIFFKIGELASLLNKIVNSL